MTAERKKALIADALPRVEKTLGLRLDALGERSLTLDEIEDLVEEVGLEANAWLEERLIEEQEPAAANRAPCPKCQNPAPYKETLHSRVLTSHGPRTVRRRYYRCTDCQVGFSPMDLRLELGPGRTATRRVRAGCPLGVRACVRAWADGPGPARLYLSMDGTMCPLREPWRKDGTLGKLVCNYRETKVGMALIADRKDGLDTGVKERGYVATLGKIVPFTLRMVWLAQQWGAHRAQELIVLGDGAVRIWKRVGKHFPRAVQILGETASGARPSGVAPAQ